MKNFQVFALLFCFSIFLIGCGGNSQADMSNIDQEDTEETQENENDGEITINNLNDAMKEAEKALKNAGIKQGVDPVNFRELKKVLPTKMRGMEITDQSGQTTGAMGFNISEAEVEFSGDDGERLDFKILDTGGISIAAMSLAAWANMTIDREDSDGYERTTTIDGYKAYEKYNTRNQNGEISLFVKDRFIVTVEGRNVDMDAIRKAVKSMDLDDLEDAG